MPYPDAGKSSAASTTGKVPVASGTTGGGVPHVAVVGAGALGGWLALWLCRRGARVTLLDAWGPGNSRSSSGDETRVLRGIYGSDGFYTDWVARALDLWLAAEGSWNERLYHPTGVLWLFSGDDSYARKSLPHMAAAGLPVAELAVASAAARFPQLSFDGVESVFFEERGGYLAARQACRAVARSVAAAGGQVRTIAAVPGGLTHAEVGEMAPLALSDGTCLAADVYVFACGPWLAELFPALLGSRLLPTRQEVFYFGTPQDGGERYGEASLPVWMDLGERIFYGIPGNHDRGFKIADDTRGPAFDPTRGDRTPGATELERARRHLAMRFPGLAGAPLLEARVCQYENTLDAHLLVDRHPEAANAWLLGGGSGHGFKLAPAVGEYAADLILTGGSPRPELALARFGAGTEAALTTQFTAGSRG